MRGIVIAGGFGTRLRPLTLTKPKPLMPLVGAPLLEYQLSYLKKAGVTEVCFATNYMAEEVEAHFGDGSSLGMKLVYAVEKEPLDTAGAIRNAYDAFPGDECVVFNGDVIHGFDIADIIRQHHERGADVTLTLRRVERPHAYGVVPMGEDAKVQGFLEPSEEQKRAVGGEPTGEFDTINAGLYIMKPDAIETIPCRRCNVEREIFPRFVSEGRRVYGDVRDDFWIDIGRPSQYLTAVRAVVEGKVGCPRPFLRRGDSAINESAEVAESAKVCCATSVGAAVRIEDEAEICASAILEGAEIGANAVIANSIIGEGVRIGPNSRLKDVVLGTGSILDAYSLAGGFA